MADEQKTDEQRKMDEQMQKNDESFIAGGKVTFSPEQQTKIQEIVDSAYTKAYAKAKADIENKNPDEKGKDDKKKDTTLPDARLKTLEGQVSALRDEKRNAELLRSITHHNVIDANEVAALIAKNVRLNEDNTFTVLNDAGVERLNAQAQPMNVQEFVTEWLAQRPHHLRAGGTTGAGSSGARGLAGGKDVLNLGDPKVWRDMPKEDIDKLLKEGVAVQGSAGQVFHFKKNVNPFTKGK